MTAPQTDAQANGPRIEHWESFPGIDALGSNRNLDKWYDGQKWVVVDGPNGGYLASMHKTKELAERGLVAWKRKKETPEASKVRKPRARSSKVLIDQSAIDAAREALKGLIYPNVLSADDLMLLALSGGITSEQQEKLRPVVEKLRTAQQAARKALALLEGKK